jgi:hypothetical protein
VVAAKVALIVVQASAILRLLQVVRDVVEVKVLVMLVTLATSHALKPIPVNFDAPLNVSASV